MSTWTDTVFISYYLLRAPWVGHLTDGTVLVSKRLYPIFQIKCSIVLRRKEKLLPIEMFRFYFSTQIGSPK